MTAPAEPRPAWTLRSEHSGAFLRLQRMLNGRRSFTLCFLTFSDSVYRDEVAGFLEGRLGPHIRVAIDPVERIGTEELFDRLRVDLRSGPAQLTGLESWPEGLDDLLGRLNQRREALAERCPRPLLVWVLSGNLKKVATRAADLWDWRSGVFDFTLPPTGIRTDRHQPHIGGPAEFAPERQARIERLQEHLARHPPSDPTDVDLLLDLGDLQRSLGDVDEAESAYSRALETVARLDDPRRRAITYGRIADILHERGQLDEALRILTEEQLPVFEKLGDAHALAITRGR
ncbi:MAG: tetratricopeptide repeat protein, partial [Acidobacteria bacterium]|nr:tetratricopeptide repeat protein [Acidobacteriota bacterium]